MNLNGIKVVFLALILPLLPILALKGRLMNYVVQSSEVLNCEDMCPEDETFVPAIANQGITIACRICLSQIPLLSFAY